MPKDTFSKMQPIRNEFKLKRKRKREKRNKSQLFSCEENLHLNLIIYSFFHQEFIIHHVCVSLSWVVEGTTVKKHAKMLAFREFIF